MKKNIKYAMFTRSALFYLNLLALGLIRIFSTYAFTAGQVFGLLALYLYAVNAALAAPVTPAFQTDRFKHVCCDPRPRGWCNFPDTACQPARSFSPSGSGLFRAARGGILMKINWKRILIAASISTALLLPTYIPPDYH